MEKHFLDDFVVGIERETPEPWYNPAGDCIIYQMKDEAIVADRIDGVLTIYRSAMNKEPIGYQIKDVARLIKILGLECIVVAHKHDSESMTAIKISAILLAAYERGPNTIQRRSGYAEAMDSGAGRSIIPSESLLAY